MNYDKMLEYHKANHADATIAVIEVPMKEASRFGIMNTNETGRIVEFEEKPEKPKSNLASMGIYIFNWKLLRKMLLADMKNPESSHDFGKDIIPTMLADEKTLFAYKFKGYWKDVGTIDSLWEANMDLLNKMSLLFHSLSVLMLILTELSSHRDVSSTELLRTQFSLQVQKLLPVQKSLTAS